MHRAVAVNDRILILSVTGDPGYGAERVLAMLVHALPDDLADRCLLLRPPRSSLARWAAATRIPHLDWSARRDAAIYNLLACFRAGRELRTQRIGLVYAWGSRAFEAALLLGKLLGARVAGTLHDHPRGGFLTPLRSRLIRASAPRLRPLVCVSHALAEACRDTGLHADCVVINNGLPAGRTRALSQGSEVVRVGFYGLYARWKGFETIRRWIGEAGRGFEWHLYGDPAPSLRRECEEVRHLPNVVFHGWEDGAGLMDAIDILVHASIEFDPYPTVLLEAARAGIPVVASSLGGSREIVADGATGFLFSPDDAAQGLQRLRLLAADPALRTRLGAAARRRFESEFGIGRMADAYVAQWNAALRGGVSACR